eukprot:CAMPEP_0204640076 /NCGR_PEP_ID=MMETSP0717-20131115/45558_1 /ASSEMBLY_ACC=CAM_ASM_000666 /TAXON_ID=230516 /ORGANISM="Chaetoceros curvisetus" /LENGTH=211 /DNA_ID=CAMNT_0051660377 /DNA_START=678 /DNA_END=1313 /DNA_ORIENTATION=+
MGDGDDKDIVDVSVHFRNASEGAELLLQKYQANSIISNPRVDDDAEYSKMMEYITNVLCLFQESAIGKSELGKNELPLYRARIVSSWGKVGQKCPRWHVDHTSLRLVLSIVGPGCRFIPNEKEDSYPGCVDRKALNELDEDDTRRANTLILPWGEDGIAVQARPGDAVLILGRAWEESQDGPTIKAAPHRSPDLGNNEFRVLLTVDIVESL